MGILSSLFAGVSGLNANGTALSVIGNNIANLSTVGFKGSRATFADLISSSISGGSGSVQTGIGVALTSVQGDFTQGSLATSSNVLDLAIDGNGFFVMRDAQNGTFYGRNGLFRLNQNSVVVDPTGFKLQGFLADTTGTITGNIGDISLPTTTAAPTVAPPTCCSSTPPARSRPSRSSRNAPAGSGPCSTTPTPSSSTATEARDIRSTSTWNTSSRSSSAWRLTTPSRWGFKAVQRLHPLTVRQSPGSQIHRAPLGSALGCTSVVRWLRRIMVASGQRT